MPGFLSEYEASETLTFGKDGQWWVKVTKFLSRGAFRTAQTALLLPVMNIKGKDSETKGNVDSAAYQNELVFAAIEDWNFTDRDGVLLPLAPADARRRSIDMLPEEVFEAIVAVIEKATPGGDEEATEDAAFRGDGAGRPVGASAGPEGTE